MLQMSHTGKWLMSNFVSKLADDTVKYLEWLSALLNFELDSS